MPSMAERPFVTQSSTLSPVLVYPRRHVGHQEIQGSDPDQGHAKRTKADLLRGTQGVSDGPRTNSPAAYHQYQERPHVGSQEMGQVRVFVTYEKEERALSDVSDRFCEETGFDPHPPPSLSQADIFKTFLRWTLDRYRIRCAQTLGTYWGQLKMILYERHGCCPALEVQRDITDVRSCSDTVRSTDSAQLSNTVVLV